MNREQTEERVRQAIEKFREAERIKDEGHKIIEDLGAMMCLDPYSRISMDLEPDATERLQMYEGVKNLAEALGVELRKPWSLWGEESKLIGFVFDGVLFFQLGKQQEDGNYTFR